MPDYGHELEFGYFLDPGASDASDTLATARFAEDLGYDLIGIQDHPYVASHLDAWALMSVILGQTGRLRVFPDVTNLQLRSAALVAKAAASLDQLSNGRFELGLGGGAPFFDEQAVGLGAAPMAPGDRVDAVEEAIAVIRAFWSGKPDPRVTGIFHQLAGVQGGPKPAHDMDIWVGGSGPRMLRLIGRAADGWLIPLMQYMPPGQAASRNATIDEAAQAAGRDPSDIRRLYNVDGRFTNEPEGPPSDEDTQIVGPVEHWVEVLTHYAVDFGFSTFLLTGPPDQQKLEMVIGEVAPRVREAVAAKRNG